MNVQANNLEPRMPPPCTFQRLKRRSSRVHLRQRRTHTMHQRLQMFESWATANFQISTRPLEGSGEIVWDHMASSCFICFLRRSRAIKSSSTPSRQISAVSFCLDAAVYTMRRPRLYSKSGTSPRQVNRRALRLLTMDTERLA